MRTFLAINKTIIHYMSNTALALDNFSLWDDINVFQDEELNLGFNEDLEIKNEDISSNQQNNNSGQLEQSGGFLPSGNFLGTEPVQNQLPEFYLDNVLNGNTLTLNQPTAYSSFYSQQLPTLDTSQPPPPQYIPAVYIHHPEGNSPDLAQTPSPSPEELYLQYNGIPPKDRSDSYASPQISSIPIITLNTNNFSGNSSNPSNIRYVAEASRKRASINVAETEHDSLNAKRIKNREAARRWRQGKKDQIADLQGEVYVLRTKLDTLQTEMETYD